MGWDLCAGLLYEHRFAMLKMPREYAEKKKKKRNVTKKKKKRLSILCKKMPRKKSQYTSFFAKKMLKEGTFVSETEKIKEPQDDDA